MGLLPLVAALVLIALTACTPPAPARPPAGYYLAPAGDDAAEGSFEAPWRTLAASLEKLKPGDVLHLRAGRYFEREITTRLQGTPEAPIVIQSYPGEKAIVDGGLPEFRSAPNTEWELVDRTTGLYRSKQAYSGKKVRGVLLQENAGLVEYADGKNLEATHYAPVQGKTPIYQGPGVQVRDGRIYLRLQPNPTDLTDSNGKPVAPVPADPDPNKNRIAIYGSEHILLLDGAAHVTFKGLTFAHAERIFDIKNGSHHVTIDGCRLDFGTYGLVVRNNVHDWTIRGSEFNGSLPEWVYWTDVKHRDQEIAEAYPEFQQAAIHGSLVRFTISSNTFRDSFDALNVADGTAETSIRDNVFRNLRDDAIELSKGIRDTEVGRNLIWRVGAGISIVGSRQPAGPVYIHHNVIDNAARQRGGRPGNYNAGSWPVWQVLDPFSSHDTEPGTAAHWRVYNNTIVTRRSGYAWNGSGPDKVQGNGEKAVLNNIFYVLDDRVILRDDESRNGARYDGNVYFRRTPGRYPMFVQFGDGKDYGSLADLRARSGADWEQVGIELDPGFDVAALEDPRFDAATIWDRYRPTNPHVFTAGAAAGPDWPETKGVGYRGAVGPKT